MVGMMGWWGGADTGEGAAMTEGLSAGCLQ